MYNPVTFAHSPHHNNGEDVCRYAKDDDGGEDVSLAHAVELLHRRVGRHDRRVDKEVERVVVEQSQEGRGSVALHNHEIFAPIILLAPMSPPELRM